MVTSLTELTENEIRSRTKSCMREFSVDFDSDFFVYVLKCDPEITLRRQLDGWNDKEMIEAVTKGEDNWLEYPARAKPPMGDHEFNYSPWVEQAVEADEVYYVGQTRNLLDRIVAHTTASDEGAYATALFPPESLVHIESAVDKQTAVALEDLISEFITYGCILYENEDYKNSGEVPDEIHDRLRKFENLPDANLDEELHLPFLYAEPNDSRTANLVYRLEQLDTVIAPWNEFEEMNAYPIAPCHISDWYITSLEQSASPVLSNYQEEILTELIEDFELWLKSSEKYSAPCESDEKLAVETGLESPTKAEEHFCELHEEGQNRIIEPFITENRKKVRELHPTPLRFAYADESAATRMELEGQKNDRGTNRASSSTPSTITNLTQKERSRLEDVVELSPTSNGALQERWGINKSADVHHYLEDHLSDWYYRDSDSQIRATEEVKDRI